MPHNGLSCTTGGTHYHLGILLGGLLWGVGLMWWLVGGWIIHFEETRKHRHCG
jgi:hypothetical protein